MTLQRVRLAEIAAEPWRNGGGRTRELLALPERAAWRLRVSVAEVESDGPFSVFPGVERHFAVLSGAGVILGFADREVRMEVASPPLRFDGNHAPSCRRVSGNVRDLNLMLRGVRGELLAARCGIAWGAAWEWRGFFTSVPARIVAPGRDSCTVAAGELVHGLDPGPWLLEHLAADGVAFWLGSGTSGSDPFPQRERV